MPFTVHLTARCPTVEGCKNLFWVTPLAMSLDGPGKAPQKGMIWPPTIEEIETEDSQIMLKFLMWLKTPATKEFKTCPDPHILALASLLKSYATEKSVFKIKLSCTLHGLTRSPELIDLTKKLGFGISYKGVKIYMQRGPIKA